MRKGGRPECSLGVMRRRLRWLVMSSAYACGLLFAVVAIAQASTRVKAGSYSGSVKHSFLDAGPKGSVSVGFDVKGRIVSSVRIVVKGLCGGMGPAQQVSFRAARISGRGTWTSTGQFPATGTVYLKLAMTGTFASDGREHGKLTFSSIGPPGCDGTTTYAAQRKVRQRLGP